MEIAMPDNEFEKTIESLNKLQEGEAKSLLKITFGYISTAVTGNGGDKFKLEVVDKLFEIYNQVPEILEKKNLGTD